jgi:hypothetical protein
VSVVIAPVSSDPRPAIHCSAPSAHLGILCQPSTPPRLLARAAHGSGTVTGQLWSFDELYGHRITVDDARAADGSLSARVCRAPWTDVAPTWCPALTTEVCASSGTVTLAAFPDTDGDVSLDAHVVLDDVTLDLRM